ncbi:MAG: hypothetical protein ACOH2H_15515 [Cypionkella sp.]
MPERAFLKLADMLTKALVTGDFGLYRSILLLPMKFTHKDGQSYLLSDEDTLREDFDLYVRIIKLHGVTDIYRKLTSFEPAGPYQVWAHWMTHILVRANLLTEPFPTRMLMRHDDKGWRIAEIESTIGHLNWSRGLAVLTPDGRFKSNE